jgi:hypothetical protein
MCNVHGESPRPQWESVFCGEITGITKESQLSVSKDVVGPVGIGGVGGSGTRVIASIVSSLGYQMGNNLNRSQDDLSFALLFKRPEAYREVRGLIPEGNPSATAAAEVFAAIRSGHRRFGSEILPMITASLSLPENEVQRAGLVTRSVRRARRIRRLGRVFLHTDHPDAGLWTWKEPNTLLFVTTLFGVIPGLHYIHVVRNGLSMAMSKNKRQLKNWGFLFGVPDDARDPQLRQLVYWARANLAVSDYLSAQPRSLIVSHERTVLEPMRVAEEISAFLGKPCTDETRKAAGLVRQPDDFERTYDPGTGGLTTSESEDVRRALTRFGYEDSIR